MSETEKKGITVKIDEGLHAQVKLRSMCTDEVNRINGIINFEKAVRYQRS